MANDLPFIEPNRELSLNVAIALILLETLAVTKRGKRTLTFERLQTLACLVLQPNLINRILYFSGKPAVELSDKEFFVIEAAYSMPDLSFSREKMKKILAFLGLKGYLRVSYDEKDGFFYDLTEAGRAVAVKLNSGYFSEVRKYTSSLSGIHAISTPQLNDFINEHASSVLLKSE